MASINNLLISWNYDVVTGSDGAGTFTVPDTSNNFSGKSHSFDANSGDFVLKEDIKTNKTLNFETLESQDTIEIRDDDDISISPIKKPSSMQLMFENSMFQVMSDEMINIFSTIDAYVFKFAEPYNRYKDTYPDLDVAREYYFSKVLSNPNLEKYMEFYKWIDSSLGYMLDQLKPASTNNQQGIKNTVESHLLERNKFQHKLPLTFQPNKIFSSGITVISSNTLTQSNVPSIVTDTISSDEIYNIDQAVNRNKNYNSIQTAGKFQNNRGNKTNKTVFRTNFSAGDGLSEKNRYASGSEFSIYNTLNLRAKNVRDQFNLEQASTSHYSHHQKDDNNFIRFNIPYTASNYANLNSASYQQFASEEVLFRQRNNILVDDNLFNKLDFALVEPPIEFNVPIKQTININTSSQNLEIYSPFTNKIAFFTPFTNKIANIFSYYFRNGNKFDYLDPSQTFFNKSKQFSQLLDIVEFEKLENIFPNKQFMGMAQSRTKPFYEEVEGNFQDMPDTTNLRVTYTHLTWSQNSFNNNNSEIRTFWKDNIDDRKRTRGIDTVNGTGSLNSINSYNLSASFSASYFLTRSVGSKKFALARNLSPGSPFYVDLIVSSSDNNFYSSVLTFDSDFNNSYTYTDITDSPISFYEINLNNKQYGDLTPYSVQDNARFFIKNSTKIANPIAKPQFVNIDDIPVFDYANFAHAIFINNFYQKPDFKLKPFYNSYKDFFENIKHKSHLYSIAPEYNVSNFDTAGFNTWNSNYLKLLGKENFSFFSETQNDFIVDFNKFASNDSNKIKVIFNGVKKLLPYKGFYPSDRSLQIANLFSKAYFESLTRSTKLTEYEKQTLLNPFFAPGILYNTIKSGIAVEYPIFTSSQELWLEKASNQSVFQHTEAIGSFYTEIKETANSLGLGSERIPFETILNPEPLFASAIKNLNYINTTYFSSGSIVLSGSNANIVAASNKYVVPTIDIEQRIRPYLSEYALEKRNYQKAINNYLSEIPNFFLKNKFFTSFVSKPESSFPVLDKDVVYKMELQIAKDLNFKLFDTADSSLNYGAFGFERSLFGPLNGEYNTISYGPSIFCPPYIGNGANTFQGSEHRTLTVSFKAPETKKFTLKEIFSNLTTSVPYPQAYMSLEACMNLKQSVPYKKLTFDAVSALPKETTFNENDNFWVMQTKFECPIVNYDNGLLVNTGSIPTKNGIAAVAVVPYYDDSNIQQGFRPLFTVEYDAKGIWNSVGRLADENSLQLKLYSGEAPYERTKVGGTQSLLDALGFQTETKNLCELADSKTISEAVVILPFCNNFSSLPQDIKRECIYFSPIEVKNLFKIKKSTINSLLQVQDYTLLSIADIKKILETNAAIDSSNSIISMMKKMVNYNIPPHLNWLLTPKRIEPFVMYIAEFENKLSKQDLADIWQGTMPTIAQTPEEQQVSLENFIAKDQLFGYDLGTAETPIEIFKKFEIKGKVFKIKKRANNNYYKLTANTEDDDRFSAAGTDWYSYNWPYDYFSLVELVNIQAGEAKGIVPIQTVSGEPINPLTNADINKQIRNAVDEFVNGIRLKNT